MEIVKGELIPLQGRELGLQRRGRMDGNGRGAAGILAGKWGGRRGVVPSVREREERERRE